MTLPDTPGHPTVSLLVLPAPALAAMLDGDLARASAVVGVELPPFFLTEDWLWRYRLEQMERDPASPPWLVRAVIALPDEVVIGHAGFHGPPDATGWWRSDTPSCRRSGDKDMAVPQPWS